jgi:hypothetical protein
VRALPLPGNEDTEDRQSPEAGTNDQGGRPAKQRGLDDRPQQQPEPGDDSADPVRSGRSALAFLESGTSQMAHATPMAATGTLIRKTDPHQKRVSSRPPTMGPSAPPAAPAPAHRAIARCRWLASRKMSVMIDSVDGIISAPPIPMPARAAIRMPADPEKAAQAEPAAKITRPARNVRLRPIRSARLPATSTRPA